MNWRSGSFVAIFHPGTALPAHETRWLPSTPAALRPSPAPSACRPPLIPSAAIAVPFIPATMLRMSSSSDGCAAVGAVERAGETRFSHGGAPDPNSRASARRRATTRAAARDPLSGRLLSGNRAREDTAATWTARARPRDCRRACGSRSGGLGSCSATARRRRVRNRSSSFAEIREHDRLDQQAPRRDVGDEIGVWYLREQAARQLVDRPIAGKIQTREAARVAPVRRGSAKPIIGSLSTASSQQSHPRRAG